MHPIERLRHVARATGGDQRVLVRETAGALHGLQLDPAGLVVACRRIVERHPTSGPLWWLCARLLTCVEPFALPGRTVGRRSEAWLLAELIEDDPTPQNVYEALPDDATVLVVGWPDLAGEALTRRGDLRVLAVDVDGDGSSLVRRLNRIDIEAQVVAPAAVAPAVLVSDVILVEAHACGPGGTLAATGSHAAAAVAYCAEVPVWLVAGRGRRLPEALWQSMIERLLVACEPWESAVERVPLELFGSIIGPDGQSGFEQSIVDVLAPECPMAPELLRTSPM